MFYNSVCILSKFSQNSTKKHLNLLSKHVVTETALLASYNTPTQST
jgi:hypothetical protein